MSTIYLDNSTTTRPSERVVSEILPFYTDRWGSFSSPHNKGQELAPAIAKSYRALYSLFDAKDEDTVIFTSSGVEAINHVILSTYFDLTMNSGRNHYIVVSNDEAPHLMATERLEQLGCTVTLLHPDAQGQISVEALGDAITPRTALLSLSWGNGLTGTVQPVEALANLCQERGVLFHLDATHILGKLFFELESLPVDFLSCNGSQLHAPKGTGALYIRKGVPCSPFLLGGMEQEGYRAGELNVPGLIGLAIAAQESLECRDLLCMEVARLRDLLETKILEYLPDAVIFFKEQERLPHCSTIAFPGLVNEALLFLLNQQGVYASIGGGTFQQLGLILTGSGVEESLAHAAISFSLSRKTTEQEIISATATIHECVQQLRRVADGI